MKVINKTKNIQIASNIKLANNIFTRTLGLLNKSSLTEDEGLLIKPCNSIHSFGMKFNFDAIFLDKNNNVKHMIKNMKPWRCSAIIFSADKTLELAPGVAEKTKIEINDILEFVE